MAQPIAITPQLPQEIAEIVEKAQTSWLSNDEVLRLLNDFPSMGIPHNTDLPNRPPGGTLFFFSRQACRNFRKDGHNWRLKNDGRSIRETHEKLKVGNTEALNCYYAHADQDDNLQRRSYWRLREDLKDLILVHYLCTAITRVNGGRGVRASKNIDTIAATRPRRASRASTRRRSNYSSEEEDDDYEFEDDEEEYEEEKIYRGGVISLGGGESSDFSDLINPSTMEALDYVAGSSAELQQLRSNTISKKRLPARQARNAARTQFPNTLDSSSSGSGQLVSSQSDELVYKNRQRMQRQAANAHTAQQQQQQPQQIFSGRPLAVNSVSFQPGQTTQTIFLAHQQQQQQEVEDHAHTANGATTMANSNPNNGVPLDHRISDPTILRQMSLGIRNTISNNMQVSLGPFHEESQELPPIAPLCNTNLMNQQPGGSTSGDGTNNHIDRLSSSDRISLSQALSSGTISGLFQPNNASQHLAAAAAAGGGSLTMSLMQTQFSRQSSGGIPRLMSDFRQDSIIMPDSLLPAIGGSFNFDADGDLPLGAILNHHHHNTTQLDPAGVHHHPKVGTTFIDRRLSAGRGDLTGGAGDGNGGGGEDKSATQTHQLDPSPMTHVLLGVGGKGSRESDMTAVIGEEADAAKNNNTTTATATATPSHLVGQISDLSPLLSELDQGSGGSGGGNYTTPSTTGSIKGEMAVRASRSVSRSGSQGNLTTLSRRSTGSGAIPVNINNCSMIMAEESAAEAAARREKRQAAAASLAATATQSDRDARLHSRRQMRQQYDAIAAAPTTTTSSAEEEYIAAIGGQNAANITISNTATEDDEMPTEMIDGPNNHLWRLQSFLFQKSKSGNNGDAAREAVSAAAVAATNGLFKHMSIDEPNAVAAVQQSLDVSGSLRRLTEEEEAAVAATATASGGGGSGMESSGAGFGSLMMMAGGNNTDLSSGGGPGIEDDLVVTGRGGSVTSKQPALGVQNRIQL